MGFLRKHEQAMQVEASNITKTTSKKHADGGSFVKLFCMFLFICFTAFGILIYQGSTGAIHEIAAGISLLIALVAFGIASIVDAIDRLNNSLRD